MRVLCVVTLAFVIGIAVPTAARAQERATETSPVRHVFDDAPLWEADATIDVMLEAPADLRVCRQGRVAVFPSWREVHMGCWPEAAGTEPRRLHLPSGSAYLALRRGPELGWVGSGATTLSDLDTLHVDLDDHLPARTAGWVVAGVGFASGLVLIILGAVLIAAPRLALIVAGGACAAAGLAVGLPLAAWGDGTRVTILPSPLRNAAP